MKENKLLELKNMLDSEGITYTYECVDWGKKNGKVDFTCYSIKYPEYPNSLVELFTTTNTKIIVVRKMDLRPGKNFFGSLRRKCSPFSTMFNESFLLRNPASAFEIIKKHHKKELED